MNLSDETRELPEGTDYLRLVEAQEDKCAIKTDGMEVEFGRNLPATVAGFGTILSLLERSAVCHWNCVGGDHAMEPLVGRVYSLSCGAYRLLRNGRYDEALLLVRGVGEISNLLTLFSVDRSRFSQWRALGQRERRNAFGPVKVRLALETLNAPLAMTESRYHKLCELSAHPGPATRPGMHNPGKLSVLGGHAQILGIVVVMNELAFLAGTAGMNAAVLLSVPDEVRTRLLEEGAAIINSVGPLNIETQELVIERWRELHGREA